MRYFIVTGVDSNNEHFDISIQSDSFPNVQYVTDCVKKAAIHQVYYITIINIIELNEQDYKDYTGKEGVNG